ncbi:MAG: manganese efflux pump MntP family protein [Candidatus Cryptobacteroides sp.]
MIIFNALLLAVSLCADCFAVSACSSVRLESLERKKVFGIAFVFGVIQSLLLFLGWFFSDLFVGYVEKFASLIGFLMLLYVGGGMIYEAAKGGEEARDLNGLKNVVIGGLATSIDAFAVGISLAMGLTPRAEVAADVAAVFAVTVASVAAGMYGGHKVGQRFGRQAEMLGGAVLIFIGLNILFDFI